MFQIKIGADPEFFLKKDGKHVSAYGLIEGTKQNPLPVEGGAVQVDGMALEFNIDPATTASDFHKNVKGVLAQLREMIPSEYEFDFSPVAEFGADYIKTQPIEATELGCSPDWNAWSGLVNPKPDGNMPFRTASGHIHVGWTQDMDPLDPEHFEAACMLTKQLDAALFLPSRFWDNDRKRRQLYGMAGAFRPKSYGMEYRVLSNRWLESDELIKAMFRVTHFATEQLLEGHQFYKSLKETTVYNRNNATAWSYFNNYWPLDASKAVYASFQEVYLKMLAEAAVKVSRRATTRRPAVNTPAQNAALQAQWDQWAAGFNTVPTVADPVPTPTPPPPPPMWVLPDDDF